MSGRLANRPARAAAEIVVFGVVQGVGFRPFVFRLAGRHGIRGRVKNAGAGVEIRAEATSPAALERFIEGLSRDAPPLALIEKITVRRVPPRGDRGFRIARTRGGGGFVFISPDIATCPECLAEVGTPGERRYRYPFANCTNCGPRYTIVRSLPYDRAATTMAGFPMCADCRREYEDPLDRRHHAQPIACPVCGPRVTLKDARTGRDLPGGIEGAADLIRRGRIVAAKGLGGFHLMCDPLRPAAVRRLRKIKERDRKPLALMARDLAALRPYARVSNEEKSLLLSPRRPIVLLRKKTDLPLIAPGLDEIGFMLPYTPLHTLLLERLPLVVATSSNPKDAPIMKDESEGIRGLADAVLTHDRPIHMRSDDSVVKVAGGRPLFVRRARSYVPYPQPVPEELRSAKCVLALGGELKDTVSLYKNGYVVTSQFLGDLDDYRNLAYFEETVGHLLRLFHAEPEIVVSDLHPGFHTTRYAAGLGLPHVRVQHHYAHVLAPLLEHGIPPGRDVLGISLDGYGYGEDGEAWGGEFLIAGYASWRRLARLAAVPLPGGDAAAREPWRMALAYLRDAYGRRLPSLPAMKAVSPRAVEGLLEMMDAGLRSPLTSSCGRLFDAVSFLCGSAPGKVEYEAEAAMKLEALAGRRRAAAYPFDFDAAAVPARLSFAPAMRAIVADLGRGASPSLVAARFHETLSRAILAVAEEARRGRGIETAALTGGVFLNRRLLVRTTELLEKAGFRVIRPVLYSPGDESLSLGQAAHALGRLASGTAL